MCLSAAPATFSGTRIACHKLPNGDQVMFYENTATNQAPGGAPNAMILLIQSERTLGESNIIDTSDAPNILEDMWDACRPRTRGMTRGISFGGLLGGEKSIVVEMGIYHIVLADTARGIQRGIQKKVPAEKQAAIPNEILTSLEKLAPGYRFAVACFNNSDAKKATPIGVRFTPANPDYFVFPALDGHDGKAPQLASNVQVNHWLFAGANRGVPVSYRDLPSAEAIHEFLPANVRGREFAGYMTNGDFYIPVADATSGNWETMRRGILDLN